MGQVSRRFLAFSSRFFGFSLALATLALATAPVALSATPAAIDEYQGQQPPPVGGGQGGQGGVGGQGGAGGQQGVAGTEAHGGTAGAGGTAGSQAQEGGGGSLPFTGYPMTTLVWVVLVAMGAAILIRLGAAAYLWIRGSAAT
jgi:hypothetical protein